MKTNILITSAGQQVALVKDFQETLKRYFPDGKVYTTDMNPRFGGGYPFSYEAGVNMPKAIIQWVKGEKVDAAILKPEIGKMFAKNDYLLEIK